MYWRMMLLAAAALMVAACTPKHEAKPRPVSEPILEKAAAPDTLDYDFLGEEVPEVEAVKESYRAEPDIPAATEAITEIPAETPPAPLESGIEDIQAGEGLIWVQIFATGSEEKAREMAREAEQSLSYRVAVHQLDPYWKVLVGGFQTREEALRLRDRLVGMGYDDAWIFRP